MGVGLLTYRFYRASTKARGKMIEVYVNEATNLADFDMNDGIRMVLGLWPRLIILDIYRHKASGRREIVRVMYPVAGWSER